MNKIAQGVDIGRWYGSDIGRRPSDAPSNIIENLVTTAVIIAGVGLLFMIMISGYQFISSSGGDPKSKEAARNRLTWGIIGFIIVFAAFWFIQLLEAVTGDKFFTNPGF